MTEFYPSVVCKLVKEMGWNSGFNIPFANEENQRMEKMLEERQKELIEIKDELQNDSENVKSLQKHLASAKEDLLLTQNLLTAKRTALESEQNYFQLSERFQNKVKGDLCHVEQELMDKLEKNGRKKEYLERKKGVVEELQELLKWDQGALSEWEAKALKNEDEMNVIEAIKDMDEKHIQELQNKLTQLGSQQKVLLKELDKYSLSTKKSQEEFDRVTSEFRKMHRQRQEIVTFWGGSVSVMKKKDDSMTELAREFEFIRGDLRAVKCEIEARTKQIQLEEENCKSSDCKLSALDKSIGNLKDSLSRTKDVFERLQDELTNTQIHISKGSQEVYYSQNELTKINIRICGHFEKIQGMERAIQRIRERHEDVKSKYQGSDCSISELESLLEREEESYECLIKELERMRNYNMERSNEKTFIQKEIVGIDAKAKRVKGQVNSQCQIEYKNIEALAKNQSGIYRMDLILAGLESRLVKMTQQSVDKEFLEMEGQVGQLKIEREKLACEERYAQKELEYVDHLIEVHSRNIDRLSQDKVKLRDALLVICLDCERIEKHLLDLIKELQDLQMIDSLEKVKLRRIEQQIDGVGSELESVSCFRNTIQTAAGERRAEIESHKSAKMCTQRTLKNETTRINTNYLDVSNYIKKLKGRYELLTGGEVEEGSGEENALKAEMERISKEKDALNREMIDWEKRVEEATKVLEGMSNVYKVIKCSNESFKDSLSPIEKDSQEAEHLSVLECEEKRLNLILTQFRKSLEFLAVQLAQMDSNINLTQKEVERLSRVFQERYKHLGLILNELLCQKEKIERWDNLGNKLAQRIRSTLSEEELVIVETELKRKFITEKFKCSMTMLERGLCAFPHMKRDVLHFLDNREVPEDIDQRIRHCQSPTSSFHIPSAESLFPDANIKRSSAICSKPGEKAQSSRSSSQFSSFSHSQTVRGKTS